MGGIFSSKNNSDLSQWTDLGPQTTAGTGTNGSDLDAFKKLLGYSDAGPGTADITNSLDATKSLGDLLKQYSTQGGNQPTQADVDTSNSLATKLYAARQTGLNQSFTDQTTQAARLAASLGRSVDDPILQAKLRTGMMRQQDSLNAEQQGFAANYAQQMPTQRLAFATDRASLLGNLAQQAFSNRAAILGYGNQLQQQSRQWQLASGKQRQVGEQSSTPSPFAIGAGLLGLGIGAFTGMAGAGGAGGVAGLTAAGGAAGATGGFGTSMAPVMAQGGTSYSSASPRIPGANGDRGNIFGEF
jgi:hypothetical protein